MSKTCQHAAEGCDYPAGQCIGACDPVKQSVSMERLQAKLASAEKACNDLAEDLGETRRERDHWHSRLLAEVADRRRLQALNQELLESLKEVTFLLEASLKLRGEPHPGSIGAKARAAIAKATTN